MSRSFNEARMRGMRREKALKAGWLYVALQRSPHARDETMPVAATAGAGTFNEARMRGMRRLHHQLLRGAEVPSTKPACAG